MHASALIVPYPNLIMRIEFSTITIRCRFFLGTSSHLSYMLHYIYSVVVGRECGKLTDAFMYCVRLNISALLLCDAFAVIFFFNGSRRNQRTQICKQRNEIIYFRIRPEKIFVIRLSTS